MSGVAGLRKGARRRELSAASARSTSTTRATAARRSKRSRRSSVSGLSSDLARASAARRRLGRGARRFEEGAGNPSPGGDRKDVASPGLAPSRSGGHGCGRRSPPTAIGPGARRTQSLGRSGALLHSCPVRRPGGTAARVSSHVVHPRPGRIEGGAMFALMAKGWPPETTT